MLQLERTVVFYMICTQRLLEKQNMKTQQVPFSLSCISTLSLQTYNIIFLIPFLFFSPQRSNESLFPEIWQFTQEPVY